MKKEMNALEVNRDTMKSQVKDSFESLEEFDKVSAVIATGVATVVGTIGGLSTVFLLDGEKQRKLGADREITSEEALQLRANMLKGKSELKLEKA